MGAWLQPLADWAAAERRHLARGLSRNLWLAGFALVAFLAVLEGILVMLAGLFLTLSAQMPPWQAGLVAGGALVVVALLVLAIVAHALRLKPIPPPAPIVSAPAAEATHLLQAAGEILGRSRLKLSDFIVGALVAGLVIGAKNRRLGSARKYP
jgi:hypothetical protein